MKTPTLLAFFSGFTIFLAVAAAEDAKVAAIRPPELGFFSKQIVCQGIPIKAHKDVADVALLEAQRRIGRMLEHMPTVVENLVDVGAEMHIIGKNQQNSDLPYLRHWKGKAYESYGKTFRSFDERNRGIGGVLSSCGEENLLKLPSDRYADHRDICSHEFAHAIFGLGLSANVQKVVRNQFEKSKAKGLWKTAYASTNADEFFAELTMWYFGSRGDYGRIVPTPNEGREWLRHYDPEAFGVLDSIYSGRAKFQRITWEKLTPHPARDEANLRSLSSSNATILVLDNRTSIDYSLFWLDYEGKRESRGVLPAGERVEESTFATHPWLITKRDGQGVAIYIPGKTHGMILLK